MNDHFAIHSKVPASTANPDEPHRVRLLEALLSSIKDFAYTFDRDGRFTYVNKPLLDLWGLTLDQAVGKNFFDLKYPDDLAAKLQRQIQFVFQTRQEVVDETPYTSPSGLPGFYEYIFAPVLGPSGNVEMVAGTTRVITDRKILLAALENERARLADVIERAPAFICTLRGPDHILELANERYYQLIGKRGIIGMKLRDALPELAGQGYFELLDHVYQTGEVFAGNEMPVQLRPGENGALHQLYVHFVYQALRDVDGNISGIFVHGVEVTDLVSGRHALREALSGESAARAQAEEASAAKSEFLAALSHELRTPLTPVLLTTSLIERHPGLPEELREAVASIRQNVELESRLISDLLDLTRVSAGKLHLDEQNVDLHLIIQSAIDICQREASARLALQLHATGHTVRGDRTRLHQVFWNLINNAIKFTGQDGTITIRSSDAPNGMIRVDVIDTGRGIDAEVLPKLFTPFEQGEMRLIRQQSGLGLGLAISKKLTEAHGGTIHVASEGRGRGATFTVELPTVDSLADSRVPADQSFPASGGRSLSLLLVEDHQATLMALTKLLRAMGHEVTGANSIASATAATRQNRFDLIISDLGLPDGSGLDLMRAVREKYAGRVIALTGYGMDSDVTASREAGFAEHLTKPVDLTALADAVRRVADRSTRS